MVEGCFRLLYMDTDSFAFALSGNIEDLVKPDMASLYQTEKYEWFLSDNSSFQQRFPGKLKTEFVTENGVFVGLSPKVIKQYTPGLLDFSIFMRFFENCRKKYA